MKRIGQLDVWAHQFYKIRSQIVHEGFTQQMCFIATDSKNSNKGSSYQSILSYVRQVFQLCLGTLLCGSELSEKAGLKETFITNQERFERICTILSDTGSPIYDRLGSLESLITTIQRYQHISENNLQLKTMLSATRHAARELLEHGEKVPKELREHLEHLINSGKTKKRIHELEELKKLSDIFPKYPDLSETILGRFVYAIVELVWRKSFMHYYWLKEKPEDISKLN